MSDSARDLLTRGIAAAKSNEPDQAKKYFLWSLRNQPDERQRVDALYWLARLADGAPKENYLLEVLQLEPTHFAARRDLAELRGEIEPSNFVDPDQPQLPEQPERIIPEERRFDCPQCGGHMEYEASRQRLMCRYCGYQSGLAQALAEGASVYEEDFIQALATAKGHLHPQSVAVFECQACGAGYLLEPDMLSITCAHCGASYAIDNPQQVELIPPQGIIPFSITQGEAGRKLRDWLSSQRLAALDRLGEVRGLYLPIWTFDVSGEAPYHYQRYDGNEWIDEKGSQLLLYNDLPVAASHHLPKKLADEVHNFDLSKLEPYDRSQIAGWPAETYSIAPRKAAMAARWHVVEETRRKVRQNIFGRTRSLELRSADLLISAYRLALLPFWLSSFVYQGNPYQAVINGQNGQVKAEKPALGLQGWLKRLLG